MNAEEYYAKVEVIKRRQKNDLDLLAMEYVRANMSHKGTPISVGDILEGPGGCIRFDRYIVATRFGLSKGTPYAIFKGVRVRKTDHKPFVSGQVLAVYQPSILAHYPKGRP